MVTNEHQFIGPAMAQQKHTTYCERQQQMDNMSNKNQL